MTVERNYAKSQYTAKYQTWLGEALQHPWALLCDLTVSLINDLSRLLGIHTPTILASELAIAGKRVQKLVGICQKLGADEYLSPIGSFGYIEDDNLFPDAEIRLLYQHYEHPIYRQLHGAFVPHLSVLDLLPNEGARSLKIIQSGKRTPYTAEEVRELGGEVQ
jgi:hypothetical protein